EPSQHLGPDNTRNVRDACSGRIQRWILGEREDRPDLSRYLLRSWGGQLQKRALRHQIIVYRTVRKQAILHLAHLEKMRLVMCSVHDFFLDHFRALVRVE